MEKTSESKKNFNLIPDRINTIKDMFGGNNIDSIIDFKNSTESFEYSTNKDDIRELLSKKYIDFGKAINELGGKLLYIKSEQSERERRG